jgi:hypothetical protein
MMSVLPALNSKLWWWWFAVCGFWVVVRLFLPADSVEF